MSARDFEKRVRAGRAIAARLTIPHSRSEALRAIDRIIFLEFGTPEMRLKLARLAAAHRLWFAQGKRRPTVERDRAIHRLVREAPDYGITRRLAIDKVASAWGLKRHTVENILAGR